MLPNTPLVKQVGYNTITLRKLHEIEETGKRFVQLDYDYQLPNNMDMAPGKYVFDPRNAWVMRQSHLAYKDKVKQKAIITYSKVQSEIPLIDEIEYSREDGDGTTFRQHYKVLEIIPGPVDEEEFTLEHYGLATPKQRSKLYWILFWNGIFILLLLLAIGLRIGARYLRSNAAK